MPLLPFSNKPSLSLQVASETHVFIFDLMALNTEPALDTLLSRLLHSTQVLPFAICSWLAEWRLLYLLLYWWPLHSYNLLKLLLSGSEAGMWPGLRLEDPEGFLP